MFFKVASYPEGHARGGLGPVGRDEARKGGREGKEGREEWRKGREGKAATQTDVKGT